MSGPTSPNGGCVGEWGLPRQCIEFTLPTETAYILPGYSFRAEIYSETGTQATWKMHGDAAGFVSGSTVVGEVRTPSSSIDVKGLHIGRATLIAVSADQRHSGGFEIGVVDSNAIQRVRIGMFTYPQQVVRGQIKPLWAQLDGLVDGLTRGVGGYPSWTTSDSSVATVRVEKSDSEPFLRAYLIGHSVGSVTVIATFLGVRDTLRTEVVP